jgi:hypothetical protein
MGCFPYRKLLDPWFEGLIFSLTMYAVLKP